MQFTYDAINTYGRTVHGHVEAINHRSACSKIRGRGLIPVLVRGSTCKRKYNKISYPAIFRLFWSSWLCKRGYHLFDEVLSSGDHYLHCDICGFEVPIHSPFKINLSEHNADPMYLQRDLSDAHEIIASWPKWKRELADHVLLPSKPPKSIQQFSAELGRRAWAHRA